MATAANRDYVFTLVGATGSVGREMVSLLEARGFPVRELRLISSENSAGGTLKFHDKSITVKKLSPEVFSGADIAFFTAGSAVSREFAPLAAKTGVLVVDNTSAFRMEEDVPLAIPEVNPEVLEKLSDRRIISVPNCSTIQMVVALAPIHRKYKIRRIVMSSYQSVSGAGRRATEELSRQVADLFNYRELQVEKLPHRIAFNLIPQIDVPMEDGSTGEEAKICGETKKILGDSEIGVSATAVRVPTFHGHAESINIETEKPGTPEEVRVLLASAPGVVVLDDLKEGVYPMPFDIAGTDDVFVGRIRKDPSRQNCLNLWVVADNLRKGAALNGLQIMEYLVHRGLV